MLIGNVIHFTGQPALYVSCCDNGFIFGDNTIGKLCQYVNTTVLKTLWQEVLFHH